MTEPEWVVWARRLRAIAQTGLAYGESEYDLERYRQIARIADEIFAGHTGADLSQIEDFFAQDSGYATPQVDVRGAVFRDGQVLLVRERLDGLWTLPGGFADVNDSPSKAVEREIFEESGFRARASKLAMVYDKSLHGHPPSPRHTYKLFFVCDLLGGEATTSFETTAVEFFDVDNLPPLSTHRITETQIRRLLEHARQPGLPTEFD
ncbi:MAG: NUDIX hydrolase [Thermomicrobiales bacterium]